MYRRSLVVGLAVALAGCNTAGHKPFGELGDKVAGSFIQDKPTTTAATAPERKPSVMKYSTMQWETVEYSYTVNGEQKTTDKAYTANTRKEWISASHNGKNWSFSIETPELNRTPNNAHVAVLVETEGNNKIFLTGWVYEGVVNILESKNPGKTEQLADVLNSEKWVSISYDTEQFNGQRWETDQAEYMFMLNGAPEALRKAKG